MPPSRAECRASGEKRTRTFRRSGFFFWQSREGDQQGCRTGAGGFSDCRGSGSPALQAIPGQAGEEVPSAGAEGGAGVGAGGHILQSPLRPGLPVPGVGSENRAGFPESAPERAESDGGTAVSARRFAILEGSGSSSGADMIFLKKIIDFSRSYARIGVTILGRCT